ncbi:MAG: VOC family protein [Flavobacterium sp.]|nr:VOC family protein [Pedobacter sp.]
METENQTATLGDKKQPIANKQRITPFLWFDGKAEEAADFYSSVIKNCTMLSTMPGPGGSVMSATFQINGQEFIAFNGGPMFKFSPAISFFLPCQTEQEIDALWAELSLGGKVLMALDKYPFSEKYGWIEDKFGISWQLLLGEPGQKISPSFLFAGQHHGKAEEAIHFYTSIFQNSDIGQIERYSEEDNDPTGTIMYASFTLAGQEFAAMDSAMDHAFNFTPGISLFVKCETQLEIDQFWNSLSEAGKTNRCGWLEDKFGVSWQIVPPVLGEMLSDPNREKAKRVMDAMLKMDKIILKDLEQAYNNDSEIIGSENDQKPLVINRIFNLPLSKVWQAWTESESIKKWWGPKDITCPYAFIDLKEGGKYLSCMLSPNGDEFWTTGVYKEIVINKKLVCTDSFSDKNGNVVPASDYKMPGNWPLESFLTVTFEETEGKTEMQLQHQGLPPEMLDDCKIGWEQSFDKLDEYVK